MNLKLTWPALTVAILLTACTTIPTGPSVMVLPGTGKGFEQFRADDLVCRQFAADQIGGTTANQVAADNTVRSAALGTAVGALAGAAMGGHEGAGTGAGVGLLMGTAAGAGTGESSGHGAQRRYDNAYIQCMYSYGHKVPVSGRLMSAPAQTPSAASSSVPPPPPGTPPPPPPN
jgi:phage tail tape-measure protein